VGDGGIASPSTSALNLGQLSASRPAALSLFPNGKEAWWAPEPAKTPCGREQFCPNLESNSTVQPIFHRLTDRVIPGLNRIINEQWIGNYVEGNCYGLSFKVDLLYWRLPRGQKKSTDIFSQGSRSSDRGLNPVPPCYYALSHEVWFGDNDDHCLVTAIPKKV
jgi:hypothetical protein